MVLMSHCLVDAIDYLYLMTIPGCSANDHVVGMWLLEHPPVTASHAALQFKLLSLHLSARLFTMQSDTSRIQHVSVLCVSHTLWAECCSGMMLLRGSSM